MIINESTNLDVSSIKKNDWIVIKNGGNLIPAKVEYLSMNPLRSSRVWSNGERLIELSSLKSIKYHAKSEKDANDWIKKNR